METAPWYLSVTPLVTVPWLVRLRWTSVAIQVAALTAGVALTGYDFPLRRVWPFILAAAVVHGLRAVTLSRTSATPAWLDLNKSSHSVKVIGQPDLDELKKQVNINLIIEYYSR